MNSAACKTDAAACNGEVCGDLKKLKALMGWITHERLLLENR
jgi:hypothetical protein